MACIIGIQVVRWIAGTSHAGAVDGGIRERSDISPLQQAGCTIPRTRPQAKRGARVALASVCMFANFYGSAIAQHRGYDHRGDYHGRPYPPPYRGRPGYPGGYYPPPPVVYGSPYYPPPPVVYNPGIGINLPGVSINVR